MDPFSIILLLGGGLLLYKGLSGASTPGASSPAAQATAQGVSEVSAAGAYGSSTVQQADVSETALSGGAVHSATGIASGAGSGLAAGASLTTIGITAGIGAVVGIAAYLWGQHQARVRGATNENAGWNEITIGFYNSASGIMAAYNSGQIDAPTAVNEFQALKKLIYQDAQSYNHQPGVDWSGGGSQPGLGATLQKAWTIACNKTCTVGCCLFNNWLAPAINNICYMLQGKPYYSSPSGLTTGTTINIGPHPSNSYGLRTDSGLTLTMTR